jgi:hypothetical protein
MPEVQCAAHRPEGSSAVHDHCGVVATNGHKMFRNDLMRQKQPRPQGTIVFSAPNDVHNGNFNVDFTTRTKASSLENSRGPDAFQATRQQPRFFHLNRVGNHAK